MDCSGRVFRMSLSWSRNPLLHMVSLVACKANHADYRVFWFEIRGQDTDKVLPQLSIWNLSVSPQDDSRQISRMSVIEKTVSFFDYSGKLDY